MKKIEKKELKEIIIINKNSLKFMRRKLRKFKMKYKYAK